MLSAVIGDIVGSTFEIENHRSEFFEFFRTNARFTDDTICTFAFAKLLNEINSLNDLTYEKISNELRIVCTVYLNRGFGSMFMQWITNGVNKPYGSYGNGALMRISPVFNVGIRNHWSLEKIKEVATKMTVITHSHERALSAVNFYMEILYLIHEERLAGKSKQQLNELLLSKINEIKLPMKSIKEYQVSLDFDLTVETSLSVALSAFIEADDFEHMLRLVVSAGGDTDTYCAIAGPLGEVFWWDEETRKQYNKEIVRYFRSFDADILNNIESSYSKILV